MLKFKDVTYQIPNGQIIYQDLNLEIGPFEFFGILGKNGAGKSTLVEMIMGMRKLETGSIEVFGESPDFSSREQKSKIFIVSNDMLIPSNIKVKDMHDFYQFFYPCYDKEIQDNLLELFEIDPKFKFGSLSTGQRVKAMLACGFAAKAELYLFDEVTAVLDPKSRHNFFKYLKKHRVKYPCSMLMATNIAEDLNQSVDKILFIDDNHKVQIRGVEHIHRLFELDEDIA